MRRAVVVMALVAGVAGSARAQEASHRDGFAWLRTGPVGIGGISDVSTHPAHPDLVATADLDGGVWLSPDGGAHWHLVLPPLATGGELSRDEDILREVEARLEEVLENPDDAELDALLEGEEITEEQEEELVERARQAAEEAAEQVRGELQADREGTLDLADDAPVDPAVRPRVWVGPTGGLLVGRADGLLVSDDLGESWSRAVEEPVTALVRLPERGVWVAGTPDGFLLSTDGRLWSEAAAGPAVHDLAVAEAGVYAATSDGLWFAEDGRAWVPVGATRERVLAVLPDPEGGLWFATEEALFHSDDRGAAPRPVPGGPLPGVRAMLRLGPGHLLVASAEGPWESVDGGVTFEPILRGLTREETRDLDGGGRDVLLAAADGVFRLAPVSEEIASSTRLGTEDFVPVEVLVDTAVARRGLEEPRSRGVIRFLGSAAPRLHVEARYTPRGDLTYTQASGTARGVEGTFRAVARLEWSPAGRRSGTEIQAIILDGDVYVDDGRDRSLITARLNRQALAYRQHVVQDITELYFARAELMGRAPLVRAESLHARVDHEIRIREIEARLDVLTEGAVSAWQVDSRSAKETP